MRPQGPRSLPSRMVASKNLQVSGDRAPIRLSTLLFFPACSLLRPVAGPAPYETAPDQFVLVRSVWRRIRKMQMDFLARLRSCALSAVVAAAAALSTGGGAAAQTPVRVSLD